MGRALAGVVQLRQLENGEWRPFASGIVIDPYWILTAGHAAVSVSNRQNLQVCLWLNDTMRGFDVEEIRKNSGYLAEGFDQQDMAAVKLASPVPTETVLPLLMHYHWYSTRWQNRDSPLTAVGRVRAEGTPILYDEVSLALAPHDGTGLNGKIAFQLQGGFADGCSGGALLAHQNAGYLGVIGMIIKGGSLYRDTAASSFVLGNDLLLPWLKDQGIPHATRDAKACFSAFQWTPLSSAAVNAFLKSGQVSELLNWNSALTPLVGREDEIETFNRWLLSEDPLRRLHCRLVYGEGGVGKTRFIKHWAEMVSQQHDWQIIDAHVSGIAMVTDKLKLWKRGAPAWLIVIDYPELLGDLASNLRQWRGLASNVRIILISRYGNSFWSALENALNTSEMLWDSYEFSPLRIPQSHKLLCDALTAMTISSERVPLADYQNWMDSIGEKKHDKEALLYPLMTVGLGLCLALDPALDFQALNHQKVLDALVKREWRHLENLERPLALPRNQQYWLHRLHLIAILTGPIHLHTLQALATNAAENRHAWLPPAEEIELLLGDKGLNLLCADHFQPLTPDVFATAFAVRAYIELGFNRGRGGFPEMLGQLLDRSDLEKTLPLFAQRRSDARRWLTQSLEKAYNDLRLTFVQQPSRYERALAFFFNCDHQLLELGADTLAWDVKRQSERAAADFVAYGPYLAKSLDCWSTILSELGLHTEALGASRSAVKIKRKLAGVGLIDHGASLASSLNNWSNKLSINNQHAEALNAILEAVEILRKLVSADFEAHGRQLATALNTLSIELSIHGRHDEALDVITEAVGIYSELPTSNFVSDSLHHARALNTRSIELSYYGWHKKALSASTKAIKIVRELATLNFAAHGPYYAHCLITWSNRLAHNDQHGQALDAIADAVKIYRDLASANFTAHGPLLAQCLNSWSIRLSNIGRNAEALTVIKEAVTICRELATASFSIHGSTLGNCLLTQFLYHERTIPNLIEIVEIFQKLHGYSFDQWVQRFPNLLEEFHSDALAAQQQALAEAIVQIIETIGVRKNRSEPEWLVNCEVDINSDAAPGQSRANSWFGAILSRFKTKFSHHNNG